MRIRQLGVLLTTILAAPVLAGDATDRGTPLRATLNARARHINVGDPVWIEFSIENVSDEPVTLFVSGTDPEIVDERMGLPFAHVFSGEAFGGVTIRNDAGRTWDVAIGYQPPAVAPVVTVAPQSSVGLTLNVRAYYPALRTPGWYWIKWAPYGGSLESNTVLIQVAPLKQAEIVTDHGTMTVQFFYEDCPNHIENFIELAQKGFYNNLTFHRIHPGYCIEGGCPRGDGTGIRPDGTKLTAEITDRPQTRGVLSMSRLEDDPDSASCQFFITYTRVPEWDGRYTVFGELIGDESYETLDKLMNLPAEHDGEPVDKLFIRSIRIMDAPR